MSVFELNRNQMKDLKEWFLMATVGHVTEDMMARADELVSDQEVYDRYGSATFRESDFAPAPF